MSQLRQIRQRLAQLASRPWLLEGLLLVIGLVIVYPLWVVDRPPIQDLPQHVAAVRVLASYSDPIYRFREYFELTLGRTQYLTVYLLAAPLAKIVGPTVATKAVLSLALIVTPLALLRLVRALDFDPWLAFLALPFVFNVHVAYGFLNFVAAIPLLFWGLALTVERRCHPSWKLSLLLAGTLFVTFYTHVVPFASLLMAAILLTAWQRRQILEQALVLFPSAAALLLWLVMSPAGQVVSSLGRVASAAPATAVHLPFGAAIRMLPDWIFHITTAESENLRLIAWFMGALVLLVLSVVFPSSTSGARVLTLPRFVVLALSPLAMAAYFALPNGYGFIWPICQRFPVLAIYLGVPIFSLAPRWALRIGALGASLLAVGAATEQAAVFRDAGEKGYRGFDEVIGKIPTGSRVAVLIFERQLEGLQLSPLMHAAGWVQAERGGVVMFSFAEFPSSPFTYRANRRPPLVAPRWEWGPERVVPDRDLGWYDFCVVQGWSGSLEASRWFDETWRRGRWSLWRRTGPADASPSRD